MVSSGHLIHMENKTSSHRPVAASIEKLINDLPPLSPNCSIYRVPPKLRSLNEKVYTPQVVSIGPFHHGNEKFKAMEEHKLRYLKAFLLRTSTLSLMDCECLTREWEDEIHTCYADTIDLSEDEFVKMVLVDSCFIIEAIISYFDGTFRRTLYLPKSNFLYKTDLMLIENQLPFFVLDRLYHQAFPSSSPSQFLEYCIKYFFSRLIIKVDADTLINRVNMWVVDGYKINHFVDLLRLCHFPSSRRSLSQRDADLVMMPNATNLQDSGITLKKGSNSFTLDIHYADGVLTIPQFNVYESSEYLLSNILVLEMCHYKHDSYIRDYIYFMDMLIDTPKDADLLIHNGVIYNELSDSSAVANLFNNVGTNFPIIDRNYYFYKVSRELEAYCSVPRHRWKATFKRDYCSTPWMIASTTAAIILLALTLIQTICSIVSLF